MNPDSIEDFNLSTQGWIPCLLKSGEVGELSIKEALTNAKEVVEICDQSPVVTASIHRLLLAVLQRTSGPSTYKGLKEMWTRGNWEDEPLVEYLEKWNVRFSLFSNERPFYQIPGLSAGRLNTINKLAQELSAGNNTILFDHSFDDVPNPIPPPRVARLLIASQSFALGGGNSSAGVKFRHAPLVDKAVVLLRGENLLETLMLNLVPYDSDAPLEPLGQESSKGDGVDRPTWENDSTERPGSERYLRGYLDYLTWQSRAVRLIPEASNGKTLVGKMYFSQGVRIKNEAFYDPMAAYRLSKDKGWLPVRIDVEREPWRSLAALMHVPDTANRTPRAFREVSELIEDHTLSIRARFGLDVFGLCSNQAKIFQWRHARIPLPAVFLENKELMKEIDDAIQTSERFARVLTTSTMFLAERLLCFDEGRRPDRKSADTLAESFDPLRRYWARLEVPFYRLVSDLEEAQDHQVREELRQKWAEDAGGSAKDIFFEYLGNLDTNARNLKATVLAKAKFYREHARARKESGG